MEELKEDVWEIMVELAKPKFDLAYIDSLKPPDILQSENRPLLSVLLQQRVLPHMLRYRFQYTMRPPEETLNPIDPECLFFRAELANLERYQLALLRQFGSMLLKRGVDFTIWPTMGLGRRIYGEDSFGRSRSVEILVNEKAVDEVKDILATEYKLFSLPRLNLFKSFDDPYSDLADPVIDRLYPFIQRMAQSLSTDGSRPLMTIRPYKDNGPQPMGLWKSANDRAITTDLLGLPLRVPDLIDSFLLLANEAAVFMQSLTASIIGSDLELGRFANLNILLDQVVSSEEGIEIIAERIFEHQLQVPMGYFFRKMNALFQGDSLDALIRVIGTSESDSKDDILVLDVNSEGQIVPGKREIRIPHQDISGRLCNPNRWLNGVHLLTANGVVIRNGEIGQIIAAKVASAKEKKEKVKIKSPRDLHPS